MESIIAFTYRGASPALMGACVERNIGLCFFSPKGKYLAEINSGSHGNVLLRKEQYRISDSPDRSVAYAKHMILGKVYNCRWSLERTMRDHELRVDSEKIKNISTELKEGLVKIRNCADLSSLRGVEGVFASRYFSVFDELIINQKEDFFFRGRNRRPPLDKINALLSFTYTILSHDCSSALKSVGLDPYVGFLHRDRPGRASLALDLMEELRPLMADRFIISLINKKIINKTHFEQNEGQAVLLNEDGRRKLFTAWQNKKKEEISHPFLKEKIQWGLVPYTQALLLSRTIRGDLKEYPPFFWK